MKRKKTGSPSVNDVEKIKDRFLGDIKKEKDIEKKKRICKKYIEEDLSSVFSLIKNLGEKNRVEIGKKTNEVRQFIAEQMNSMGKKKKEKNRWIDISFPGKKINSGSVHPLTQMQERCVDIFKKMGFDAIEGPEMVNEWYNFDALNFAQDHPVREMQDTLFLKQKNRDELSEREKLLMRTHT